MTVFPSHLLPRGGQRPAARLPGRKPRLQWVGVVLLVAVLLVQQWGLLHRYAHGGIAKWGVEVSEIAKAEGGQFSSHDVSACLALDQACLGDAVAHAPLGVLAALVGLGLVALVAWADYTAPTPIQRARGPPGV